MASLRLRQALVRHKLYSPLHKGLPPYDPRNGIAFATIPLHLRHVFRRLNDVVFYSFQSGHVVYLRNQREVRGLNGYLCITHDSILQLQDDSKCPRWLDIEDVSGIDYVLQGSHSFVSILSVHPYPDFLFIPTFPVYPLCSTFDAEEAVEGIVYMLRRLLMQRIRTGEAVSLDLRKYSDPQETANAAEEIAEYDEMCHIRNVSAQYSDVFAYIANQGAGRPLEWRWDNSKTPPRFTYKLELAEALKREENDSSPEDSEDDGHHHEGVVPLQRPSPLNNSSMVGDSFAATTMAQLLAAPSQSAELRAMDRLRVTRADPLQRQRQTAGQVKAGLGLPPRKPTSIGLVPSSKVDSSQPVTPQVVPVDKGLKVRPKEDLDHLSLVSSNTTTEDEEDDDDAFDSEDIDDLFEANVPDSKDVQVSSEDEEPLH
ncbi:hypothetical protein AGDE_14092 [Angomonas deanei]|uniref:Uncharacterized protein n=1 Tax=Angomonas deanei TaxID=59799 RepID=A0A7G2C2U6_9TRYP|nr:hypothetical protein AGDE_14092 [Angomonas deanei]CAD2213521.1 hypothetical protein, conserved [Angomonas deanei]|eukprot:EPY21389.1 hypothetical protein AGDE_14092 [Angomonas deanei]